MTTETQSIVSTMVNPDDFFHEEGAIGMEVVGGLISLGLAAFLFMLVAVISGKTFSSIEDDVAAIGGAADYNALAPDYIADQIDGNIILTSRATFVTIKDLTDLLPIFGFLFVFGALAVIVSNLSNVVSGGGGIRSAL